MPWWQSPTEHGDRQIIENGRIILKTDLKEVSCKVVNYFEVAVAEFNSRPFC
jgi:hypothetical protein